MTNLACALTTRYDIHKDENDLETALRLHTEVLTEHPPGHAQRFLGLANVKEMLRRKLEALDFDENIMDTDTGTLFLEWKIFII